MKESIIIQNVGPLKDVEIDNIRPLTVLIGESGSGKSTMMKIIVLMRYIYKMLNIRWYLKNSGVSKSPFKLKIKSLISDDLTLYLNGNKEAYIRYSVTINNNEYVVEYKDGDLNTKGASDIPNEDLYFMKESWISESRSIIPMWKAKSAINKKAELGFYFHETLSDFEKATEAVRDLSLDFIGMNLHVEGQDGKRKYYLVPQDGEYEQIELKFASSGMQTVTPLATLLHYFAQEYSFKEAGKRSILEYLYEQDRLSSYRPEMEIMDLHKQVHVHVEEPELSLYPDAQCELLEAIVEEVFVKKAADREMGIMIATHSPYIVNHLNLLMRRNGKAAEELVSLDADNVEVYEILDGSVVPLKTLEERPIIDTRVLSDPIARTYNELKKY